MTGLPVSEKNRVSIQLVTARGPFGTVVEPALPRRVQRKGTHRQLHPLGANFSRGDSDQQALVVTRGGG